MKVRRPRMPGERFTCECGAVCIVARSRHGTAGPITIKPPENGRGNVLLFKAEDGVLSYAILPRGDALPIPGQETEKDRVFRRFLNENRELGKMLRVNHFADCPVADRFRAKKEESDGSGSEPGE